MKTEVILLFPFDLGLELDFSKRQIKEIVHSVSVEELSEMAFEERAFDDVRAEFRLYRFGVGMIRVGFTIDDTPDGLAAIACQAESLNIGGDPILLWCQNRVQELIDKAQEFATHRYDQRLLETEIFPVFIFGQKDVKKSDHFIREHYKALYGIAAGEAQFDRLSDFVFQRDPLANFGYYENELILVKRFGAAISSSESGTVLDLISLIYAQYWSLKAYDFVLNAEVDGAQKLLQDLPPYYKFWQIPSKYQTFSKEAIDFGKDKLSIVESLYSVSTNLPAVENDWHLRMIYNSLTKVFNTEEMYKTIEIKLDRIEESYNEAREFLSTNFFILLDFVFFAWLIWGVIDTFLLLAIAKK